MAAGAVARPDAYAAAGDSPIFMRQDGRRTLRIFALLPTAGHARAVHARFLVHAALGCASFLGVGLSAETTELVSTLLRASEADFMGAQTVRRLGDLSRMLQRAVAGLQGQRKGASETLAITEGVTRTRALLDKALMLLQREIGGVALVDAPASAFRVECRVAAGGSGEAPAVYNLLFTGGAVGEAVLAALPPTGVKRWDYVDVPRHGHEDHWSDALLSHADPQHVLLSTDGSHHSSGVADAECLVGLARFLIRHPDARLHVNHAEPAAPHRRIHRRGWRGSLRPRSSDVHARSHAPHAPALHGSAGEGSRAPTQHVSAQHPGRGHSVSRPGGAPATPEGHSLRPAEGRWKPGLPVHRAGQGVSDALEVPRFRDSALGGGRRVSFSSIIEDDLHHAGQRATGFGAHAAFDRSKMPLADSSSATRGRGALGYGRIDKEQFSGLRPVSDNPSLSASQRPASPPFRGPGSSPNRASSPLPGRLPQSKLRALENVLQQGGGRLRIAEAMLAHRMRQLVHEELRLGYSSTQPAPASTGLSTGAPIRGSHPSSTLAASRRGVPMSGVAADAAASQCTDDVDHELKLAAAVDAVLRRIQWNMEPAMDIVLGTEEAPLPQHDEKEAQPHATLQAHSSSAIPEFGAARPQRQGPEPVAHKASAAYRRPGSAARQQQVGEASSGQMTKASLFRR